MVRVHVYAERAVLSQPALFPKLGKDLACDLLSLEAALRPAGVMVRAGGGSSWPLEAV